MRFREPNGPRRPRPAGAQPRRPGLFAGFFLPQVVRRHGPVRRATIIGLGIPVLLLGLALAPPRAARADPLSDAIAQQRALQQQISDQKSKIAQLTALQASLTTKIASTKASLASVNADLDTVRAQVGDMSARIAVVQARYDDLVAQLKSLDAQLIQVRAEEALKAEQLAARKAQLADRIRNTYDVDRTSLLEIVLSSDSFTDFLAEASYYLDVAAQDRALAAQIADDQKVLAEVHETAVYMHDQTEQLRQATDAQKQDLDAQLADLNAAQAKLQALEAETQRLLSQQQAAYASLKLTKTQAEKQLADQAAAEKQLQAKINDLVAQQARLGRIPSVYNGTLTWPMAGTITQEFGCTGVIWEPPLGSCPHFHRGIDIANDMYTPVHAAGPGTVVFAGPNPYDAYPKAWIVIIAHSTSLRTWYGHLDNGPHPIPVVAGQVVRTGDVIGYEGMTGNTTGPHLHWAVELESEFVNPRLFL